MLHLLCKHPNCLALRISLYLSSSTCSTSKSNRLPTFLLQNNFIVSVKCNLRQYRCWLCFVISFSEYIRLYSSKHMPLKHHSVLFFRFMLRKNTFFFFLFKNAVLLINIALKTKESISFIMFRLQTFSEMEVLERAL